MKKTVLIAILLLLVGSLHAQSPANIYQFLGKKKSFIKQKLSKLTLIRDWGEGNPIDYEDARGANLKFKCNAQNVCEGISLFNFKDESNRINATLKYISKDQWQLVNAWKSGASTCYRFTKQGKQLNARVTDKQMLVIGYPTSKFGWRKAPANINQSLVANEKKRISSGVATPSKPNTTVATGKPEIMATIVRLQGNQLTVYTPNIPSHLKVGAAGNISRFYKKKLGNTSMSYWLVIGKGTITGIQGQVITFNITDRMKMTINGKTKNFFVKGQEVKFAWGE